MDEDEEDAIAFAAWTVFVFMRVEWWPLMPPSLPLISPADLSAAFAEGQTVDIRSEGWLL